jgi:UDP-N-acetylmuramoylalanine--D-glutamate ligase
MATLTWRKARHVILFGQAAELIEEAMRRTAPGENAGTKTAIHHAGTLERAVGLAAKVARRGDVVLLSPGGTSFDAYQDYEQRGEHFRKLVEGLR